MPEERRGEPRYGTRPEILGVFAVIMAIVLFVAISGHRLIEKDAQKCAASGGTLVKAAAGGHVCLRAASSS